MYVDSENAVTRICQWWVSRKAGNHGLINSKDTKAKCRHLKKWVFAAGVHLSKAPYPYSFCLGWSSNFVGSESGQIQSVKLLRNMVSQQDSTHPPPSQPHTVCTYIRYFDTEKGGRELNQRVGSKGNISQSWFENTTMTDCISSL